MSVRLLRGPLDRRPRRHVVGGELAPAWQIPTGPSLTYWGDEVLAVGAGGIYQVTSEPPVDATLRPWPCIVPGGIGLRPGVDGVLVGSNDGRISRRMPDATWEEQWRCPRAVQVSGISLGNGRILVYETVGRSEVVSYAIGPDGAEIWRPPTTLHLDAATPEYVVGWVDKLRTLVRVDPETGAELWRWTPPDPASAIGEVDGVLWYGCQPQRKPHQLVALDAETGRVAAMVTQGGPFPALDPEGVVHFCYGGWYSQVDLEAGGVQRSIVTWSTETGASAHGGCTLLEDGIVFRSYRGAALWRLPNGGDTPELVWRPDQPIVGGGIQPGFGGIFVSLVDNRLVGLMPSE